MFNGYLFVFGGFDGMKRNDLYRAKVEQNDGQQLINGQPQRTLPATSPHEETKDPLLLDVSEVDQSEQMSHTEKGSFTSQIANHSEVITKKN